MCMARKFKTVDYEVALHQTVTVEECLSPNHLARFIVAIIAQLDLSRIYAHYAPVGGEPIDPQVLLVAQEAGALNLGNISLDGSKLHADASKSHAVSYKRLIELESQLRQEVDELFALGEQLEQRDLPAGLDIADEIVFREGRLVNLAQAKRVLEARAQERYAAEHAEYEAKLHEREEKAQQTGRKPSGRP